MTAKDPVELVREALEASVRPMVVARGGGIRFVGVEGGEAVLEVTGSPGAVVPLLSRIETQVRAAVPEVTGIRLVAPSSGPTHAGSADDFEGRVRAVIEAEINPVVAAHHGHVVIAVADQGWVHVRLEGGCQGCSLAEVTVRQGIEPLLRARHPEIVGVLDVTDHAAGSDPYFSPEKR